MTLQAIKWSKANGKLEILDQTLLPATTSYIQIKDIEDGWQVINKMQVNSFYLQLYLPPCLLINNKLFNMITLNVTSASKISQISDNKMLTVCWLIGSKFDQIFTADSQSVSALSSRSVDTTC